MLFLGIGDILKSSGDISSATMKYLYKTLKHEFDIP